MIIDPAIAEIQEMHSSIEIDENCAANYHTIIGHWIRNEYPAFIIRSGGSIAHYVLYDIIRQATTAAATTKRRSIQRMKVLTQFLYDCILAFLMHGNGGSNTEIILTKEY